MTVNQLRQVARTYTTQWSCWVTAFFWLLMHGMLLGSVARRWTEVPVAEQLRDIMGPPLMASLWLGLMIGMMLKLQFANPRARLLPGFGAAHFFVAAAIVSVATAIEAFLVPVWAGTAALLAVLSVTFLAIVGTVWIAYLMRPIGFYLLIVLILVHSFARQYVTGLIQVLIDDPTVSLGIACVGLAALAALGVRLWMLCEEMPEYSRQSSVRWDFTSRAGSRRLRRLEAQAITRGGLQAWVLDTPFGLVLRGNSAAGTWRRLLFRQLAGGFSSLSAMISVFAVVACVLWIQSWSQPATEAGEVVFLSFMPVQLVLSMVGGMWLRCWPFLARESLWPVGRRDFVRDLARSLACDLAPAAAVHCAMIVVCLELFSPQGALPGHHLRWIGLTAAQYAVAYCLLFWLISTRRFWVLLVGTLSISILSSALVIAGLFAARAFWSPVIVAAAFVVIALGVGLLYRVAFRRWCYVDLG